MKIFTTAICFVSVAVLSGCVDDRGYRSGGYYSTTVYSRTHDNDRYYRDRDYRRDRGRDWRDRRGDWRDNDRGRYRYGDNRVIYGVTTR